MILSFRLLYERILKCIRINEDKTKPNNTCLYKFDDFLHLVEKIFSFMLSVILILLDKKHLYSFSAHVYFVTFM